MNVFLKYVSRVFLKCRCLFTKDDGFGVNELLGICAALILAAFIVIPGLRGFAEKVVEEMNDWWDTTIASELFPKE